MSETQPGLKVADVLFDAQLFPGPPWPRSQFAGQVFDAGGRAGLLEGFRVGWCAHKVAAQEWAAGFRVCERCNQDDYVHTPRPIVDPSPAVLEAVDTAVEVAVESEYGRASARDRLRAERDAWHEVHAAIATPYAAAVAAALAAPPYRDHADPAGVLAQGTRVYTDYVLQLLVAGGLAARLCQCVQLYPAGCPHDPKAAGTVCSGHTEAGVPVIAGVTLCGECHCSEYGTLQADQPKPRS